MLWPEGQFGTAGNGKYVVGNHTHSRMSPHILLDHFKGLVEGRKQVICCKLFCNLIFDLYSASYSLGNPTWDYLFCGRSGHTLS